MQKNTSFYLVPVLLFAYIITQRSQQLSWSVLLPWMGGLLILSVPILIWSWWSESKVLTRRSFWLGWAAALVVYPALLIIVLGLQRSSAQFLTKGNWSQASGGGSIIIFFFAVQCLLSLALIANESWRARPRLRSIADWNIRRLAVIVLVLFALSIVLVSNYFQEAVRGLDTTTKVLLYLLAVLQVFIIFSTYYVIYYVHHHWLFNRLLQRGGLLHYVLGAVGFLLLFVPFQNLFISLFPAVHQYKIHPVGIVPEVLNDLNFTLASIFFLLTLPFIIVVEWYRKQRAITILEKEKTATELQLLKQQINPHFFFNTLNNLYAMSLTQERETPEVILKLSELMRYVIYQGQKEEVSLQQELDYLQGYLDLQSLRLHQGLDLKFDVDIEDRECRIPPLLFVILVENAFKHGIEPAENPAFLHLALRQEGEVVEFSCANSKAPKPAVLADAGIGLSNLKRRLAVHFPNRHEFQMAEDAKRFTASIKLML
ncbi:MAG: sensor histidine kinase [Bacteroidota bacterium]